MTARKTALLRMRWKESVYDGPLAKMAFHEGKTCDAVVRVLEAREGQSRRDVRSPEKDGDPAPIELTCWIGDRLFAFEHTGIERFAGHVKFEAEASRHLDPIRGMLAGKPPNDVFELHMPAMAMQGKRKREIEQIQIALAAWIEATAPTLKAAPYASYPRDIQSGRSYLGFLGASSFRCEDSRL
jgi:hypothetical protein